MTTSQQSRELFLTGEYSISEIAAKLNTHYSVVFQATKHLNQPALFVSQPPLHTPIPFQFIKSVAQDSSLIGKFRMKIIQCVNEDLSQMFKDGQYCRMRSGQNNITITIITHLITQNSFRTINNLEGEIMHLCYELIGNQKCKINCIIENDRHTYSINL